MTKTADGVVFQWGMRLFVPDRAARHVFIHETCEAEQDLTYGTISRRGDLQYYKIFLPESYATYDAACGALREMLCMTCDGVRFVPGMTVYAVDLGDYDDHRCDFIEFQTPSATKVDEDGHFDWPSGFEGWWHLNRVSDVYADRQAARLQYLSCLRSSKLTAAEAIDKVKEIWRTAAIPAYALGYKNAMKDVFGLEPLDLSDEA